MNRGIRIWRGVAIETGDFSQGNHTPLHAYSTELKKPADTRLCLWLAFAVRCLLAELPGSIKAGTGTWNADVTVESSMPGAVVTARGVAGWRRSPHPPKNENSAFFL